MCILPQDGEHIKHVGYRSEVQNLQRDASTATVSLHRGQVLEGSGGGAGASFKSILVIRYTTMAMIRKSTTLPKKVPMLMVLTTSLPSAPMRLPNSRSEEHTSELQSL